MNYRNKQAGGTILGIIIGLIIGLGIAVGVAMTINKVPAPFINKAKQDKPPEQAASQMVDLNKSLYGNREPAKEAAKEFAKEPAEPAAADPKAAAADKAKKPDAEVKPGDNKDAAKDATAKPDPAAEDKWTYYLQAGAFREQADAENAKAKLALLGFETKVSERTTDNGTLYRVRVGPFSQVDAMNKVRSKLSDNGVDVAVVRIPK